MVIGLKSAPDGFSLIELLVVVAVMSALSVGAVLAIGGAGPTASRDAARFQTLYAAERDLAIASQTARMLRLDGVGWTVVSQSGGAARVSGNGRWGVSAQIGAAAGNALVVEFLADGRTTGFQIAFADRSGAVTCRTDGWADLDCAAR